MKNKAFTFVPDPNAVGEVHSTKKLAPIAEGSAPIAEGSAPAAEAPAPVAEAPAPATAKPAPATAKPAPVNPLKRFLCVGAVLWDYLFYMA